MADVKISDLPLATTPVAGTEVMPLVQSGVTVKTAISNIAPVRSVNSKTGVVSLTSDDITEGSTNKYATLANTRNAISATQNVSYNSTTGVITGPDLSTYLVDGDIGVTVQGYTSVLQDTTASFTTAKDTKLAGIETGAEANVNADWNAVSGDAQILNKPAIPTKTSDLTNDSGFITSAPVTSVAGKTGAVSLVAADISDLGTAATTNSTAYATAAQGTKADTAVQPADITNMLETTDIGLSVQAYNANTVVDASYVHTDNNYTTAEKTKLSGIASGAEVNVNADWNAVSGDAQILNKPTLGTAAAQDTTYFATAAQGTKADSALQPADIGVSVQAYDSDLTSWAAITPSSKQDALVSGTNIKSINSTSLLGSGDIVLFNGGLTNVSVVASLPGSPDANTLYIVTT